jgi:hypothetical protein
LLDLLPEPTNLVAVIIPVVLTLIVPETALAIPAVVAYPEVDELPDTFSSNVTSYISS